MDPHLVMFMFGAALGLCLGIATVSIVWECRQERRRRRMAAERRQDKESYWKRRARHLTFLGDRD